MPTQPVVLKAPISLPLVFEATAATPMLVIVPIDMPEAEVAGLVETYTREVA